MKLKRIAERFSVCKVQQLWPENLAGEFVFVGKTDEEFSLVCPTSQVPEETVEREDGWRAFRIEGQLDFSLVGILAPIATCLAEAKIGIFAVSTYNTDYVLVKEADFERAMNMLMAAEYDVV